ncbi:DUF3800 domain-containing protein [Leptospira noguchii]|uniref:DUF3800 domain-containing protein n=1 Tax=Leptospira noguchii TaxID=28182 RepID=UPI001FB7E1AE|nr:DUF3800 domain-containing protein [Leptospira noguchii]UOG62632.1 DUF3800 domain-containing protein [Leptospira noguchii]
MNHVCYFDEFGNSGLDFSKNGNSSHFILGGVIVKDSDHKSLEALREKISVKHFSGNEIKSSNVGKDDERRFRILGELLEGNYLIHCMVFNKKLIFGNGLKYKKSFYKYLNKLAYRSLYTAFPNIKIVADQHGSKEFMKGFSIYIEKNYKSKDFFSKTEFIFEDSKHQSLIQIADFMIGTIARYYEETVTSKNRQQFLDILISSGKLLPIRTWPEISDRKYEPFKELLFERSEIDEKVFQISLRNADLFISENVKNDDELVQFQVATCRTLVFYATTSKRFEHISTPRLVEQINAGNRKRINDKQFGRSIIGPLRDANVLISSNKDGYKLIACESDLREFIQYFDHFIRPMLKRIKSYRETMLYATENKIDIIGDKQYDYLKHILEM